jgi:general secretion pathway protein B
MSFILDALKKSENERQEQAETEFATVPSSPDAPAAPRWLWILGGLLTINIIVLLGLMLRPDSEPVTAAPNTASTPAAETTALATDSFSDQVATARRNQPERSNSQAPASSGVAIAEPTPVVRTTSSPVSVANLPVSATAILPSLVELRANGTLQLPDLHVDIHVYSDVPAERFVFINMNKYREHSSLDEGPLLKEITSDGVILEYRGIAFMLPRE